MSSLKEKVNAGSAEGEEWQLRFREQGALLKKQSRVFLKDWKHISEDAKALIRMMLKFDPSQRSTAEQVEQNKLRCAVGPAGAAARMDQVLRVPFAHI